MVSPFRVVPRLPVSRLDGKPVSVGTGTPPSSSDVRTDVRQTRALPLRRRLLPNRGMPLLFALTALTHGSAAASSAPRMLAGPSVRPGVADVAAELASSLERLDFAEQQLVLGAFACAHFPEDAVMRAACDAMGGGDGSHAMRLLAASSSSGSGSISSSGSGVDPNCPYKSDVHHPPNREHIELMVCAVIMITVVFEVFTHWLDNASANVPHIYQIVQRVYKELMLLGIISFGLFFFESNFCLPPEITHELHVIHILIFYIAISYIAEALFTLAVANIVASRWHTMEKISLVHYAGLKLHLAAINERLKGRNVVWRSFSWYLLYKQHSIRASAAYQVSQHQRRRQRQRSGSSSSNSSSGSSNRSAAAETAAAATEAVVAAGAEATAGVFAFPPSTPPSHPTCPLPLARAGRALAVRLLQPAAPRFSLRRLPPAVHPPSLRRASAHPLGHLAGGVHASAAGPFHPHLICEPHAPRRLHGRTRLY